MRLALSFVAVLAGGVESIYSLLAGSMERRWIWRLDAQNEGHIIPKTWGLDSLKEPRTRAALGMMLACGFPQSVADLHCEEVGRIVLGGMEKRLGWQISARLFVVACYGIIDKRCKLPPLSRLREARDVSELWKENE